MNKLLVFAKGNIKKHLLADSQNPQGDVSKTNNLRLNANTKIRF